MTKKRELKHILGEMSSELARLKSSTHRAIDEAVICGMLLAEARSDSKLAIVPSSGPWPAVVGDPALISAKLHTLHAFIRGELEAHASAPRA